VVITGLSGSGKSSLAFDTLYAEGQRRYVESLSPTRASSCELMEKPDVDLIEGLSPAIAIEQKAASHNPRSTVGTVTEIHDYLRLLYARVGTPYCPEHGLALEAQTVAQMVDHVLALPEDTKLMILAPVVAGRKGEQADLFEELRAQGFTRVRVDGKVHELDTQHAAPGEESKHTVEVVIDRLRVQRGVQAALAESFETALRHADGKAIVFDLDTQEGNALLVEVLLPAVRLRARRTRAAPVSRSTTRWAPARAATAWARWSSSTRAAWWRTRTCRSPAARSRAGTGATISTTRC
jgi:excinuclease ABC subunit A